MTTAPLRNGKRCIFLFRPAQIASPTYRRLQQKIHINVQASDANLEALAERNLADIRELDGDRPGALRHLRRCRSLAQRGRNAALEADVCRRLSSVYAEIAAAASGHGALDQPAATAKVGGLFMGGERGDEEAEDNSENALQETEVRDIAYRGVTASVGQASGNWQ